MSPTFNFMGMLIVPLLLLVVDGRCDAGAAGLDVKGFELPQ
jgi:hypothetical protein